MLRFDLNISILLREVPFLERFERAASLGFGAVEFWWPGDENLSAIVERVRASGLAVALINFDAGDLAGGERGFLNDASRQEQFRTHVPIALEFAQQVGCSRLNALVVSTGAKFVEQTWTAVVRAALDQSGLPAFLLYSGRLFHQVMSASAHRLERALARTSASPTTLTCMLICIRAWPASLGRGVPLTGFSRPTCSRTGRVRTQPARTVLPCRETENLSVSYMRSILHQQDRLVKGLGSSEM